MEALTNEQVELNKKRYIELINSIEREGMEKEKLLTKLENSDFYYAPASSMYHASFIGGLCWHSLNVYDQLVSEVNSTYGSINDSPFSEDTIKIVSLLHDFSKMNLYETTMKNVKVYSPNGSKKDEGGNFDWVAVQGFKKKDATNRFIYGNHEETSEYMIRAFVPLFTQESVAVMYHHGGLGYDSTKMDISAIYNAYPLALLLHTADMKATYIVEKSITHD